MPAERIESWTINVDAALRLIGGNSNRDVVFAVGVLGILVVLFAPLPAWALDLGLTFSLAFSILILMVALWIEKPLDFSSFPTVLLIVTILRLALNIASTRLILSNGHTGTSEGRDDYPSQRPELLCRDGRPD